MEKRSKLQNLSEDKVITMIRTPQELRRKIKMLGEREPITLNFEQALERRGVWSRETAWYSTQKEHWLGWLSAYSGPGFYGL